jgi:hypothetical protein
MKDWGSDAADESRALAAEHDHPPPTCTRSSSTS